jgi:hypothetical protein
MSKKKTLIKVSEKGDIISFGPNLRNSFNEPKYEKTLLTSLNQIYYWVYKCTTCHHYTNIIKNGLIDLIIIRSLFKTEKGLA